VPALKQMHEISKSVVKSQYRSTKSERSFLHELNRTHEVVKLVVSSLARCHQMAVESSKAQDLDLNANLVVDDRYKHRDVSFSPASARACRCSCFVVVKSTAEIRKN